MFYRLGTTTYRYRWAIIVLWLALAPMGLIFAPRAPEVLHAGGFTNPRSQGSQAIRLLHEELGASLSNVTVVFHSPTIPVRDPRFASEMQRVLTPLTDHPAVQRVHTWRSTGNDRFISPDGHTTYALVGLALDTAHAQRALADLKRALSLVEGSRPAELQVMVTGGPAAYADIELVSHRDLARAEAISLPLAAVALVVVFGGLAAAGVPALIGGISVVLTLALIYFLGQVTEVSIFAQNIATMLGLGISIDYALFIVSRFREELRHQVRATRNELRGTWYEGEGGNSFLIPHTSYLVVERAVGRTMATAGRAVFFSGLTVLLGLLGLMTFDYMMLRSIGLAGGLVVILAVAASLTLLPALLSVLGPRVNALSVRLPRWRDWGRPASPKPKVLSPRSKVRLWFRLVPSAFRVPPSAVRLLPARGNTRGTRASEGDGFWVAVASAVARRPLLVFVVTLFVLVGLGLPFLRVKLGAPDVTVLPKDVESRRGFDLLREKFGAGEIAPILIVLEAEDQILTGEHVGALYDYTRALERLPGVVRVESIVNVDPTIGKGQYQLLYSDPARIQDPVARESLRLLAAGRVTLVTVVTGYAPVAGEAQGLVRRLREIAPGPGLRSYVGGAAAELMDVVADLYGQFPRALLFIVISTYTALALQFRSLVLPAKAVLMDALSILASYGALVLLFQDGHLSGLLRFTSEGFVDATVPIVMFCVLFGLSMDYEVFMLSRVKEEYDRRGDNAAAVASGLARTGRIITSAAVIIVAVSGSFALADIIVIKALGIGMALAILLDATVVRVLLVPATMHLLGPWNWWAPNSPLSRSGGAGERSG